MREIDRCNPFILDKFHYFNRGNARTEALVDPHTTGNFPAKSLNYRCEAISVVGEGFFERRNFFVSRNRFRVVHFRVYPRVEFYNDFYKIRGLSSPQICG